MASAQIGRVAAGGDLPLCVDLDGTLVRTDTLWEASLALVLHSWRWLLIPLWLLRGKAHLKQRVAALSPLDVAGLPYNQKLLQDLKRQHAAGRSLILCTGADVRIASRVAAHLGIFDAVIASDGECNLVGSAKRKALEGRYGIRGFDYAGDSRRDVTVWRAARNAIVVNPSRRLLRILEQEKVPVTSMEAAPSGAGPLALWLRAIRIHQWAKNLLLFAPLALGHNFRVAVPAVMAFLAFGFMASSAYLINDLLDLQADRKHSHKRLRPFAAGNLPVWQGIALVPVLWTLAFLLCRALSLYFTGVLGVYLIGTLAYSLLLKRYLLIDVMVLAGLYTIRMMGGGAATGIVISPWTLAVSIFLFLSLAMVKRVSELMQFTEEETVSVPGRDYRKGDIQQLSSLGSAAGYISVVVMALYISSPDVQELYARPKWLWLMLPIALYWISRIWLLVNRGCIHQDPVIFALKDRTTYVAGSIALGIALIATL